MQCQTYQYKVAESSESPADELALDVYGQPSGQSAGRTLVYVQYVELARIHAAC